MLYGYGDPKKLTKNDVNNVFFSPFAVLPGLHNLIDKYDYQDNLNTTAGVMIDDELFMQKQNSPSLYRQF